MILRIINHKFHYEAENICREFFPFKHITLSYNTEDADDDDVCVITKCNTADKGTNIEVSVNSYNGNYTKNVIVEKSDYNDDDYRDECERVMAIMLFEQLKSVTGYEPKWGILTGVRPSKLMNTLIAQDGEQAAKDYFINQLSVKKDKAELAVNVAKAEEKIIKASKPSSFSLYVSIPFCPSRCNYCSFVSHSIEHAGKLIPEYVSNLLTEIEITAEIASRLNLKLETVYWGGGTPTTLSAEQISRITQKISDCFDFSSLKEYTIEAGRPDTITKEKLLAIKNAGVGRISINPQTFNNSVLEAIGRKHTAQQTIDAFRLAREIGFNNINMDLIAGLSTDTFESFEASLDATYNLNPENITVHTLALKRSSRIVTQGEAVESGELADKMLNSVQVNMNKNGYKPYYMYRQSRSLGNLENVGWCKQGKECIYNIIMMEECHTVLAVGGSAVTKLKEYGKNHIERIFNFKYPYEYNTRFEEILQRKQGILDFYNKYGNVSI